MTELQRDNEEHNSVGRQAVASLLFAASFALPILMFFILPMPKNVIVGTIVFFGLMTVTLLTVTGKFSRDSS